MLLSRVPQEEQDLPSKRQRVSLGEMGDAAQPQEEQGMKDSTYDLVGVARTKFIFKTRPRPIISKPHA